MKMPTEHTLHPTPDPINRFLMKIHALPTIAVCFSLFFVLSCAEGPQQFFVAPDGSDDHPGTIEQPFASLRAAQQAVRDLRSGADLPANGVQIYLRKGIYPIAETLQWGTEDSGTPDRPVIWQAYQEEEVILTGGRVVPAFTPVQDAQVRERLQEKARKNVLQADLRALGITDFGELKKSGFGRDTEPTALELFFRGLPMTLARYPNEGWLTIPAVPQSGTLQYQGDVANMGANFNGIPGGRHYGRISYDDDRPRNWQARSDIWMHGYWTWDWADMYERIESIDLDKREIHIAKPYHHYGYRQGQRYYYRNVLEELDQPGEWYLDRENGILYFWPPEAVQSNDVLVSLLKTPIMRLENAAHLSFRGLIFEASRGTAVEIAGGNHVHVAGCTFRNLGNYAIRIEGGSNHHIQSCDIYEVGDGGVYADGGERASLQAGNHKVENCHIHHYSRINRTGRPAITLKGVGNTLSHNLIHDAPHMGVWFEGNEHILEYNEIHDVAKETGDVGAFYIGRDWTCRGNVIKHNYFHHLHGPGLHGVMAVYLDDWSSGTTIYGNVFYKSGRSAFIGGGRDNTVENNLFIACEPSVHVDARGLGWASYYFDRDNPHYVNTLFDRMEAMKVNQPPFSEQYPELVNLPQDEPAIPKGNRIINNVSYGGRWLDLYNGLDFGTVTVENNLIADSLLMRWIRVNGAPAQNYAQENQEIRDLLEARGNRIVEGNPGIRDVDGEDFHLTKDSPAFEMGIQPIPFDQMGLRKDAFRANP
jgi:hypothetical protein